MKKSEFYSDYQNARNKSWEVIFNHKINSLPVDVLSLLEKMKIKAMSYEEGQSFISYFNLEEYKKNDGFTAVINKKCVIFYDGNILSQGRLRFTLAHELGHIVLGHVKAATVWNRGEDNPITPEEAQANIFASRLLAPACVLHALGIHTAEEIAQLCGLSNAAAKIRAVRMEILYRREREWQQEHDKSCFCISAKEQKVMEQFKEFIRDHNQK